MFRTALAVAVALVIGLLWWEYSYLLPKPESPRMTSEQERLFIDQTNFDWIVWGAADDMHEPADMLAAAITIENVAKSRAVPQKRIGEDGKEVTELVINARSVVSSFETLQAPSQCIVAFRTFETMYINVPKSSIAIVSQMYRAYRENPADTLQRWPWIANSLRYVRTRTLFPLPPYQFSDRMRKEMISLFDNPNGAQFFALKPGVPIKNCNRRK